MSYFFESSLATTMLLQKSPITGYRALLKESNFVPLCLNLVLSKQEMLIA
jgi:hypothetical protein